MNNRQLLIRGILACGWVEDEKTKSSTSKYLVFHREGASHKQDTRLLVGKSGALRVCRDGAPISRSVSLTDRMPPKAYRYVGSPAFLWSTADQAQAVYQGIIAGDIKI